MIDILTPLGIGLLMIGLLSRLPFHQLGCSVWCRNLLIALFIGLALLPFSGISLFNFLYGVINFFSLPSVLLLALFALRAQGIPQAKLLPQEKTLLATSTFLIGLVLYPSATGFMSFDLYETGYSYPFSLFLALLVFIAFYQGLKRLGFIYLAIWLAWLLEANRSPNGYDYLLDFWLFLWAAVFMITFIFKGVASWRKKSA